MSVLIPICLAVFELIAPKDGAVVPTLRPIQKEYLSSPRTVRHVRMANAAERAKLFAAGATQLPLKLAWKGETNAVYTVSVTKDGGMPESYSLTNVTAVYLSNLELGVRYSWMVSNETDSVVRSASFKTDGQAPRLLRADGVGNFRDLGGWRTLDGRIVRQNRIFRSAGLRSSSKASGGFLRRKVELGLRRVTDFGLTTLKDDFAIRTDLELRTPQETAGMDGTLLGEDVRWCNISFAAYDFIDNSVRGREPFVKIFRQFLKEENYPILMHCSGGRDRTGTLAFMLNALLGVPEDDLCRDWETSIFSDAAVNFAPDRLARLLDYLATYPGTTVNERVEAYVRSCGISAAEVAKFRDLMLEPVK